MDEEARDHVISPTRRERREARSPYRVARETRTPRARGGRTASDVSPTSGNILASLGTRISAFFGYTPRKDQTVRDGGFDSEMETVTVDMVEDADDDVPILPVRGQGARMVPEPRSSSAAGLPKPAFPAPPMPESASQATSLPKPQFMTPLSPFGNRSGGVPESGPSGFGFGALPVTPSLGTPWKPQPLQRPPTPATQLALSTPVKNGGLQDKGFAAEMEKYERAQARMRELWQSCKGRDMTHAEKEEWDRLMEVQKPEAPGAMSSVGSPFLFLAPPTPSAGRLFTPVKTGTAASPEISKPGTPKTPGTSIRRRQDIRYYGVGFSQRSTPGNRRPGPMRGAGASYVRGNAVRPQSSLFETMDLQGNEPPIVFNTTTSTSVPVVSLSGPRPTAWNAASEDDTDGQMATNLGANSAAVPGFPLRGSPTTAGTAAQVIQRVIQETSPPGRSNDALGTRMPRVLPINPYMVTDGDESVAKAPLLSIKPPPLAPAEKHVKLNPSPFPRAPQLTTERLTPGEVSEPRERAVAPKVLATAPPKPTFAFGTKSEHVASSEKADDKTDKGPKPLGTSQVSFGHSASSAVASTPMKFAGSLGAPEHSGFTASSALKASETPTISSSMFSVPPTLAANASSPKAFDWGAAGLKKPDNGGWTCTECMIKNNESAMVCGACEAARPGSFKPAVPSSPVQPKAKENIPVNAVNTSVEGLGLLANVKAKMKRSPPSDLRFDFKPLNKDRTDRIGVIAEATTRARGSANPDQFSFVSIGGPVLAKSGFDWASSGMKKPEQSGWKCTICMVDNPADVDQCVACEATRPRAGPAAIPAGLPMKFNFAAAGLSAPRSTGWTCSICMVNNPEDKLKCAACETERV